MIIQVPRGSAVERQLHEEPPPAVQGEGVLVQSGITDQRGNLEPPSSGEVVFSAPAPEALERQADDVARLLRQAGGGTEPLVVEIEAAEMLREEEVGPLLAAAQHAQRPVILRVIRPSER